MSSYMKGIDVSEHNGVIDWEKVKASGVRFAMLRAGYGKGNIDKRFLRNAAECARIDMPFGVYWFSYAVNEEEAAREAAHCLKVVEPYQIAGPVAYDFEYDSVKEATRRSVTVTKALASKLARTFLDAVGRAGYGAVNYANPDYLNKYFDGSVGYPLWLAQWPSTVPALDEPPRECLIWQYSAEGRVPGIGGPVDLDVCYADYELAQKLSDRQLVQRAAGLADKTMDFLECYRYGPELLRKLAAALGS